MNPERRARVALVHTRERHRSLDRILGLVEAAMLEIGGLSQIVTPGSTVLIAPDQSSFYPSEEGCTTDPYVIGALVRLCRQVGASRVLVAGLGEGMPSVWKCMHMTGMAEAALREGAELLDLESMDAPTRTVAVPRGRLLKEATLPVALLDADVIISVPKAKTDFYEPIFGVFRNWAGVLSRCLDGSPEESIDLPEQIADLMTVIRPNLCVVDGLIIGEGNGPVANLPRWCGCIMASTDPVATDVTIARLLGLDWRKLVLALEAEQRGLGVRYPIDHLGISLEQVAVRVWSGHQGFEYLPVNLVIGSGVTVSGTIGYVKSALDSLLRRGDLAKVISSRGTPTIMVGEADDPNFERHLEEGPYVVFDDAAKPKYKNDPRVYFVSGHPVLGNALLELMKGLGLSINDEGGFAEPVLEQESMQNNKHGFVKRKPISMNNSLAAAGLAAGAAIGMLLRISTVPRSKRLFEEALAPKRRKIRAPD